MENNTEGMSLRIALMHTNVNTNDSSNVNDFAHAKKKKPKNTAKKVKSIKLGVFKTEKTNGTTNSDQIGNCMQSRQSKK
ncbi:hypothetical protein O9G_001399 [Rozella allomycis CSF55]|uniref:Uncharacterized protein n=1 Tax=Rozella allomycis (strain CSF55) TaxID=988480 RepID=A0A075B570_ROZAC|nr:hypothetical protein O9G_001399 [Rozella allomycis CSF55]|eukprot:EPZ36954.1 hypothetical protein O9G_001399 [Rozella allomycis CSF55]